MTDALCRTIMHLADERDTLAVELAALRVRHSDALKSFVAQTKIAVRAMAERDEARAEVLALREGTSKATGAELQPCDPPTPAASLTDRAAAMARHPSNPTKGE